MIIHYPERNHAAIYTSKIQSCMSHMLGMHSNPIAPPPPKKKKSSYIDRTLILQGLNYDVIYCFHAVDK